MTLFAEKPRAFIDAELLYWYSNGSNLSSSIRYIAQSRNDVTDADAVAPRPVKGEGLNWSWDPGVRIGFGGFLPHDQWKLSLKWTAYYNDAHFSKNVGPFPRRQNRVVGNDFLTAPRGLDSTRFYSQIIAKYQFHFNQFDLTLGKALALSPYLKTELFFGPRVLATLLRYQVRTILHETDIPPNSNQPAFRNDLTRFQEGYWGVGLVSGLDLTWKLHRYFNLVAQGAYSLVYGKARKKMKANGVGVTVTNRIRSRSDSSYFHPSYFMTPILDLAAGVEWEALADSKCYNLNFAFLWENHFLFDLNHFEYNYSGNPRDFIFFSDGNIVLSGVTFRGTFEF